MEQPAGIGKRPPLAAARRRADKKQHVVYEFYGRFGQPLYVGCTVDFVKRLAVHAGKSWWAEVHEIHTMTYPDKHAGQDAELRLIHDLEPLYNFQGTPRHRESAREQHRRRRDTSSA